MGFSGGKYRPSEIHNDSGGPGDYAEANFTTTNGFQVRIFGKNGTIEVTDPNGRKGGITLFGDAVSSFAIDLRPFINAGAAEKYKIVVQAMGIEAVLEEIEKDRKEKYEARTVANGAMKRAKTVLDQTPVPGADIEIPDEVDVVAVSKQIQQCQKLNAGRQDMISEKSALEDQIQDIEGDIKSLIEELETAKSDLANEKNKYANFPAIPDEIDTTPLQTKLEESQATNKKRADLLRAKETYETAASAKQAAEKEAADAQAALDEVLAKKHNVITELGELPDPNLSLEDGKLLYHGKEWDCVSGAEEYIIATLIGMAQNKGCNFVLADGLECMDPEEQARYDAWGVENGVQQIGTVVTTDPNSCSIFIEDGCVKEAE